MSDIAISRADMARPADHPAALTGKVGVLLSNLGTPDAPQPAAVKRYLAEFLSDRRVVEIPAIVWQPILRGIILNTRPKKSAHAYAQVWMEQGSPLMVYSQHQTMALQEALGDNVHVALAMRYGKPSIGETLTALKQAGCTRILIAPLYPQYSGATTGTALDKVYDVLKTMRWHPVIRTLPPYYDDPAHIAALATLLERQLDALDFRPDALITSFHGMPQRTLDLGDPYHCQCRKTARLLSERLESRLGTKIIVAFQSRFGRAKWLEPATDDTLEALPKQGITKVAICAPGFSADCLETLEELAIQGKEQFQAAGGTDFAYLSCLNAEREGMDMLEALVRRELAGWIE